jgi:hypothetical protein
VNSLSFRIRRVRMAADPWDGIPSAGQTQTFIRKTSHFDEAVDVLRGFGQGLTRKEVWSTALSVHCAPPE